MHVACAWLLTSWDQETGKDFLEQVHVRCRGINMEGWTEKNQNQSQLTSEKITQHQYQTEYNHEEYSNHLPRGGRHNYVVR